MTDELKEGPTLPESIEIDEMKYRQPGESFREKCTRIADALKDNEDHFHKFRDTLLDMRFLPAGRVQASMGAAKTVTPYNCFVARTIPDSMEGIMDVAKEAAETMRLGGGIGYDFSTLRPRGFNIRSTGSPSSGPVSFMRIYDAVCKTVASAGNRRGAQMGVLRVDHPDIEEFIRAKQNKDSLTQFNISVGVTDKFMESVEKDLSFDLSFNGQVYKTISARNLWNEIMRSTWDWAEPGILFIDKINRLNNLYYCEKIASTNPCAEQPLPPNGACLLGSFNLVKYLKMDAGLKISFDLQKLLDDIPAVVRAMDNIVDRAVYPLEAQKAEAKNKRRMGLGVTGVANALEACGYPYGSTSFCNQLYFILHGFTNACYLVSANLSKEKGCFPLYTEEYLESEFIRKVIDPEIREYIAENGIRNSHLTSIAPTGTISFMADNISSGIEPVFALNIDRTIRTEKGIEQRSLKDYGYRVFGVKGKTTADVTLDEHLAVLDIASWWMDSAVSKTINVGDNVTFEEFKSVYMKAWKGEAKGCTTFRLAGKRSGVLSVAAPQEGEDGAACYYDPETGVKSCDQ